MNVKRFPEKYEEGQLSTLIFQIASRKEPEKIIATSSIIINARIFLYDWETAPLDQVVEKSSITLDPESMGIARKNSMVLVKEVYEGKTQLHIIACSSGASICENNKQRVSNLIYANTGRCSSCFPNPPNVNCQR
jgi:hypothetical protein